MEYTHFERVMHLSHKYDQEGLHFAREAVAKEGLAEALWNVIEEARKKYPLQIQEKDLVRVLLPLNARVMRYVHHITKELLRKQEDQYALTTLTEHKDYASVVGMACANNEITVVNAAGHMQYHMAAHALAGKHVYQVSPGLADQLRNTELRGLHADDLALPYKSIYIQVPQTAGLHIWNDESGWHDVIGIYVTEQTLPSRSWRFLVCGETKPVEVMKGMYDDNDALVYFQVPLPEKLSLTETLALSQNQCVQDVEELKKLGQDSFREMVDLWPDIFKWAMNVVLYMSIEDTESEEIVDNKEARQLLERIKKLSKSRKRSNLQGRLSKLELCKRIVLGKSVTTNKGSWELTVRVRVIGHWRNQPYGPGRMFRRLQWIEPHWRGPTNAEVAAAASEVAPATSGEGERDGNDTGNGASDPTIGRVATLPTEGVISGDQLLEGSGEA